MRKIGTGYFILISANSFSKSIKKKQNVHDNCVKTRDKLMDAQ